MELHWCLWVCTLLTRTLAAPPIQVPLQELELRLNDASLQEHIEKKRPLHGRFLHITDFHPDRFYEVYSSTTKDDECHHGQGSAGIYGAEGTDCDSPISLVNKTMEWIRKELKDKIDFVIWTGDSARHDNDEEYPRNDNQVLELNKWMVKKMFEVFGKHNGDEGDDNPNNDYIIPIVPTFGNNDILPHNIFRSGPNKWTRIYSRIWKQVIPEAQKHSFEQGGWFYEEVIPNKLAVFSLNTLYFFTSNAASDGCATPHVPGYRHMEWLRIQLQFMRERGMKVILTGHVPPARERAKNSWDETCWQKYTLWLRQYRDIIVTSVYGHFNYDHFILQDFKHLDRDTRRGRMSDYDTIEEGDDGDDHDFYAASKADYFVELRDAWAELPEPPEPSNVLDWSERVGDEVEELDTSEWSLVRAKQVLVDIFKNKKDKKKRKKEKEEQKRREKKFMKKMGGEFAENFAVSFVSASVVPNLFPTLRVFEYNVTGLDRSDGYDLVPPPAVLNLEIDEDEPVQEDNKDEEHIEKKKKKYKFKIPKKPSKSSPPGPAYSPQTFSLTRYVQYFANLTHINNDFDDMASTSEERHDRTPDPKRFKYEVQYDTQNDDVYQLKDLTMPNLVNLARRIGRFEAEVEEDNGVDSERSDVNGESTGVTADGEDVSASKKKHKKKKKSKEERRKQNEAWYTFIRRAYVETMSPDEVKDEFG